MPSLADPCPPYPASLRGFSSSPPSHPDSFYFYLICRLFVSQPLFPISVLARLGVKPRLCRSSWRAFASNHPFMLPSTSSRGLFFALPLLLGIPFVSPWSLPFRLHGLALISLYLTKVRLSFTLTLSPLMIWCSGLSALRPFFCSQQAQCAQVSLRTNKSATSLLLFDTRSVLATLFSPSSFVLPHSLWQELSSLSCSIRLQWIPKHSSLSGNDVADELARRGALLVPSAIPCTVSPLISRIHSSLFSDWRRTASSKFFDTQVPQFLLRNLCSLVMLAVFSLVYAATNTAFY